MHQILLFGMALIVVSTHIFANPVLSLSGSAFTGLDTNLVNQNKLVSTQFRTAANLGFGIQYSDEINAQLDIAFGNQENSNGFIRLREGAKLLGYRLTYAPKSLQRAWIFQNISFDAGLLTIPFGQFANTLSDNAAIRSSFILNDLGYSLLVKNNLFSDFGSNGLNTSANTDYGRLDVMIFNGTDNGLGDNSDRNIGFATRFVTVPLLPKTEFGFSLFHSNDSGNSSAINASTLGLMLDVKSVFWGIEYGGYIVSYNFDDFNADSSDQFLALMAYGTKRMGSFTLAARYSSIFSEDYSGDGAYNRALNPEGISMPYRSDADRTRFQLDGIYHVNNTMSIHNEFAADFYAFDALNTYAILSYASLTF